MNAAKLRQIDTDHNAKVFGLMQDGQQVKTWCYTAQGYAVVTRQGELFSVKLPKVRKPQTMTMAQAVDAVVTAHQG